MDIISHRGLWKSQAEKNTIAAFERSFSSGFGIETDIRDFNSELVISHDIPNEKCIKLDTMFLLYKKINHNLPLAINIKADGLQAKCRELIEKYGITNYFIFDMSLPETLQYIKYNLNIFTRQSEYEKVPLCYEDAIGIWVDCFREEWIDKKTILFHLNKNKRICLVSPELHKRDYKKFWGKLVKLEIPLNKLMICTDNPEEAQRFFNG
jgi:hypothetical protein